MNKKILVGMSGGIDSTWAAKALLEKGWQVEGAVLEMHDESPVEEARRAAQDLGIKLHIVNCRDAFERCVKNGLVNEYACGRVPNPCVICNSDVKFKYLADTAKKLGIEKISTGHYVKVHRNPDNGRYELICAEDSRKDQSYFLWRVSQEELSMFENVLDQEEKKQVKRKLALTGISHTEKESQEICFIPDGDRIKFIKANMSEQERENGFANGDFVDREGKVLGKHAGILNYTPGQRKGLGIALGRPAYVIGIDRYNNRVVLGFEEDNVCSRFEVDDLKFVSIPPAETAEIQCFVRVRHRGTLRPCSAKINSGRCQVSLFDVEKTVSPGQSAVFYDSSGKVLFGGFIH